MEGTNQKAVFLDLDGTLLTRDKQITAENKAAIREAMAQGHYVVLCSGRPLSTMRPLLEELEMDRNGYAVCYNGAYLYDCVKQEVVYGTPLPDPLVRAAFAAADEEAVHVQTYDDDYLLTRRPDPETDYYHSLCGIIPRYLPELPDGLTSPAYKVLCISRDEPEKLEAVRTKLMTDHGDALNLSYSSPEFLEIVKKGSDKGVGIREFCRITGLPLANTVGVGDSENDLPMLRTTALSCCMQNGTDVCKEAADYITENDCDHSGVAEVIRKFVLQEGPHA